MKIASRISLLLVCTGILIVRDARAVVVLGQVDDFENGTTQGWATGGTAPLNITTGGPAGVNDNFLKANADGSGGNGKLTVFNRVQWLGNYTGLNINAIEMDLENFGASSLNIRLAFKQTTAGGAPGYLSPAFVLPADSTWHHAIFQIAPGTLTALGSPAAFSSFFTSGGQAEMRIINELSATNLNGDNVVSSLGIDNIHAAPEPGRLLLLLGGIGSLALRRRRSR
ncbi:MAG: PEP-CTERM sorting domain-containing protein [Verrucomicrobiaceae bacterium]